jgi:putative transcriptional regulator
MLTFSVLQFRLHEALEERGLSLRWLSIHSNVAYTTLHKLKTGKQRGISFGVLQRLCEALDCEPSDLFSARNQLAAKAPKRRKVGKN